MDLPEPLGSTVVADRFLDDEGASSASFGDVAVVVLGGVAGVIVDTVGSSISDSGERIEFVSSDAIFSSTRWLGPSFFPIETLAQGPLSEEQDIC